MDKESKKMNQQGRKDVDYTHEMILEDKHNSNKSCPYIYMTHIVRGEVAGSLPPQLKDEMLDELRRSITETHNISHLL
jgi:hypothetical protein